MAGGWCEQLQVTNTETEEKGFWVKMKQNFNYIRSMITILDQEKDTFIKPYIFAKAANIPYIRTGKTPLLNTIQFSNLDDHI